jgi:hypothetical protein
VNFHVAQRQTYGRLLQAHLYNIYANLTEEGLMHNESSVAVSYGLRNGEELYPALWIDPYSAFLVCQNQMAAYGWAACSNELADAHLPAVVLYQELFWHRMGLAGSGDTDLDGCTDAQELGATPALGGDRDPQSPWDFYDVPHMFPDGTGDKLRDRRVDFTDTLTILAWFGVRPDSPQWNGDINGNGLPDGEEYARGAGPPDKPWRTVPYENVIDNNDALVNLQSFGHHCV